MSATQAARVDLRQVRALVRAFVTMSLRTLPMRTMRGQKESGRAGGFWLVVALYGFLGLVMAGMAIVIRDVLAVSFVMHVMTMFVVGSSALNEAAEVLFTTSENDVLLHRPIAPSTLLVAKGATIVVFTFLIGGALNLAASFALLGGRDARPIVPLVHLSSVVLATVFASAAIICLYGVVARLLGRERLQRVVTVVQIGSTLVLVAGFQIVPRLIGRPGSFDLGALLHESKWMWALPPMWFASLDAWLGTSTSSRLTMTLALVGIGATVACAWLGMLRLPATGDQVAALQEEPRAEITAPATVRSGGGWLDRVLRPWFATPVESATFQLVRANLARERQVKVRLFSAFAFYLIFPLLALVDPQGGRFMPMIVCWMIPLVPLNALELLRVGKNPAAADLFGYSPIERPESVFHGTRKAILVFVQAPLALWVTAVGLFTLRADPGRLLAALPALVVVPPMSLVPGLFGEYIPFSLASRSGQRALQTLFVVLAMVPVGVLGFASVYAYQHGWLWITLAVLVPLSAIAHWALLRAVAWRVARPRWAAAAS